MGGLECTTAAILAGGLGTRLKPVVKDRPKVLANVGGRPFLFFLLDQLSAAGIRHAVLCTGYQAKRVEEVIGDRFSDMEIEYSPESEPLGTAGAMRLARSRFRSDPVLVLNGDSYCSADLGTFAVWHGERRSPASLLLTEVSDTRRFGRVQVDEDGRILLFEEKEGAWGPGWINAGIYLLGAEFLGEIPGSGPVSLEKQIFPAWVSRGLRGFRGSYSFIDIGTEKSYLEADRFFQNRFGQEGISR
jgi:NDP-sugar pyrophosphorylase family protein